MNAPSKHFAVEAIRDGAYASLAKEVYGDKLFDDPDKAFEKLAQSVVAFESSARFHPFASKFDDYLRGAARTDAARGEGLRTLQGPEEGQLPRLPRRARKSCAIRRTGCSRTLRMTRSARRRTRRLRRPRRRLDLGLCKRPGLDKFAPTGFDVNSVCGAFKVPTLRNIAVTGPYLHNGVFAKLRDVVAFYATRDTDPAHWYPKGREIRRSAGEFSRAT